MNKIEIVWRNALRCEIACERAHDGQEATEVLRRMVAWNELNIGDTFEVRAVD
jgi:hypothetical protein